MPDQVTLEISTPTLVGAAPESAQRLIEAAVTRREAAACTRMHREKRRFLGRRAVIEQRPTASPRTIEPRRGLSPRVASRNKWLREEVLARCADFTRAYRDALRAWCAEQRDVVFPLGTYVMRLRYRVRCAEA